MTFTCFLRGLWFRVQSPFRRFVIETVRLGNPVPMLSHDQLTELRKRKEEATLAKAELLVARQTNNVTGRGPKPGDTIVVIDPPLLRGDMK